MVDVDLINIDSDQMGIDLPNIGRETKSNATGSVCGGEPSKNTMQWMNWKKCTDAQKIIAQSGTSTGSGVGSVHDACGAEPAWGTPQYAQYMMCKAKQTIIIKADQDKQISQINDDARNKRNLTTPTNPSSNVPVAPATITDTNTGLSTGAKIGIGITVVVVLGLVGLIIYKNIKHNMVHFDLQNMDGNETMSNVLGIDQATKAVGDIVSTGIGALEKPDLGKLIHQQCGSRFLKGKKGKDKFDKCSQRVTSEFNAAQANQIEAQARAQRSMNAPSTSGGGSDKIMGMSKTTFYIGLSVVGTLVIGTLAYFALRGKKVATK